MMYEMHDENLPGVREETQARSNFWIASLKASRMPNYEACYDSWRDVAFDRRGKLRKKPPKGVYGLCYARWSAQRRIWFIVAIEACGTQRKPNQENVWDYDEAACGSSAATPEL
jgi:hypothetical protein